MVSKTRHEGYLFIDNRVAGGSVMESATITCSHCQAIVVLNPLRTRERAYCSSCDHYLCDACGAERALKGGGRCVTYNQLVEEAQEIAVIQAQQSFHI